MSPSDFQTLGTAWVASVLTVGTAGILAYSKIKGMINDLKAKHEENAGRIDQHDAQSGISTTPIRAVPEADIRDKYPTAAQMAGPPGQLPDPQAFRQPLGQPQKP